ncbi:periplasmic binding protein-like II [Cucurbitaria berberidis CBS 394.84]|uniref:Periplasmic binding protein-like II n=1 Tax=Cucurbitaria berberidis CBS 394.84 TaxID=1168544 RepID=A0A9P4GF33_9PLEO|nr:periplasmic binding protein-like II [Cucurbitaria berberidis CBS 394.84]KAF1844457.1 periplasmic binding protein-like II [Cucurbitaria berberidis CBS 394.84]
MRCSIFSLACLVTSAVASSPVTSNVSKVHEETRSLDEIHKAALAEGGVVTLWHGGDEANQQSSLKTAFEARFPGMTLNVTVDLSKYHDGNLDQQIADGNVQVDSIILQTLHDYPRWKEQGVLLNYAPANFGKVHGSFKDADAAYMGLLIFAWGLIANVNKTNTVLAEYPDFLKPEFKDKLVLTYPNDDDAVLYQFDLIIQQYGLSWFDALLAQNPRWVRGTETPATLIRSANSSSVATFTSGISLPLPAGNTLPTQGEFVSWPQTGAILKKAPHPEGAKLLHNFLLSTEHQTTQGWSVRDDLPAPAGLSKIWEQEGTNITGFGAWMSDRANVERRKYWYENKIGTAQGLSPLVDDL